MVLPSKIAVFSIAGSLVSETRTCFPRPPS
jgi:hypothetical protein